MCDLVPINKVKVLLGGFNTNLGQEIIFRPTIGKESLHRVSNENGTRLVQFAFSHKDLHK